MLRSDKDSCVTFVISQSEVEVAGNRCSQGEIKAVTAQRFVLIHCTDGLDHLRTTGTSEKKD